MISENRKAGRHWCYKSSSEAYFIVIYHSFYLFSLVWLILYRFSKICQRSLFFSSIRRKIFDTPLPNRPHFTIKSATCRDAKFCVSVFIQFCVSAFFCCAKFATSHPKPKHTQKPTLLPSFPINVFLIEFNNLIRSRPSYIIHFY